MRGEGEEDESGFEEWGLVVRTGEKEVAVTFGEGACGEWDKGSVRYVEREKSRERVG